MDSTGLSVRLLCCALPLSLAALTSCARAQTSCDLNGDGVVDLVDVQMIENWQPPAVCPSTVNVVGPGICNDLARQVVLNAALGQACHYISLNWKASLSPGVKGYYIYRGTRPNAPDPKPLNSTVVSGTSYNDTTVRDRTRYYYTVRAADRNNQSNPSNESSAAVP